MRINFVSGVLETNTTCLFVVCLAGVDLKFTRTISLDRNPLNLMHVQVVLSYRVENLHLFFEPLSRECRGATVAKSNVP